MDAVAFDYGKQKWVEVAEAVRVRSEQIRASLELLRGARAAQFARFNGMGVETMIENLENELAGLKVAECSHKDKVFIEQGQYWLCQSCGAQTKTILGAFWHTPYSKGGAS